jgi:hypothetical protein
MKMDAFWNVAPCNFEETARRFRGTYCLTALVMEAVRTSETSIYFNETTLRYIPEDSHIHTGCLMNEILLAIVCRKNSENFKRRNLLQ